MAYDLKKMQKVTANVLGRLGCPACHSGFDIRFIQARDYVGVQEIVTFYALVVVVVSLLIDTLSAIIDPRIRY